jgi:equilibrative nucleoside transporter 1/2/3
LFKFLQSFLAGLAASGALTSALRLITKAAFDNSQDGFRKGASMFNPLLILLHVIFISKSSNEK